MTGDVGEVGVGIMVAHNPLDRSGRAAFPHPALASGDNAEAAQRVWMMYARSGQPAVNNPQHPVPQHTAVLAASRQGAPPEPDRLEPKQVERPPVHGDPVVSIVPLDYRTQPPTHFRDGVVHAPLELGFHLTQFGLQALAYRLPQHREPPVAPLLPADMREAEEVEGLGLPLPAALSILGRIRPELQQPGFVGVQLQPELAQSFGEFLPEPLGIGPLLESEHDVIGVAHDDHVAASLLVTPHPDPQVEYVVEINVREQRRNATTLRGSLFHPHSLPILQHARVQPFLDEPHHAPVRNPVLEELHQPAVVDGIKEPTDVQVEHPVHLSRQQSDIERIQRVVLAASGPEPVREPEEVGFVDGVKHLDRGALDDLVFQRRHPERPLLPFGLGDVHPAHRLGPVRSPLKPLREIVEVFLQLLAVVAPRLAVHSCRSFSLKREIRRAQGGQIVDVVQERSELHPPISGCRQTCPLQRTGRAFPALGPGRVLLGRIPFGRSPSLHHLRRRLPGLVRRLQRYYGTVRLPALVHRRRVSLDFPTRPAPPSGTGEHRTSRFSCEVFPYVHGVSDRAGPERISRYRCVRYCLPLLLTASASRRNILSWLNTRPARTSVNASTLPLREAPHDSRPSWVAGPLTCDSFIHNTSPVYPGAQGADYERLRHYASSNGAWSFRFRSIGARNRGCRLRWRLHPGSGERRADVLAVRCECHEAHSYRHLDREHLSA